MEKITLHEELGYRSYITIWIRCNMQQLESLYIELKKSFNFKAIFYSMHPSVHVTAKWNALHALQTHHHLVNEIPTILKLV